MTKYNEIKAEIAVVKGQAQAGGLPATNQAVQDLCDKITLILDRLEIAVCLEKRD